MSPLTIEDHLLIKALRIEKLRAVDKMIAVFSETAEITHFIFVKIRFYRFCCQFGFQILSSSLASCKTKNCCVHTLVFVV